VASGHHDSATAASSAHHDPLVFELLRRRERSLLAALRPRARLVAVTDAATGMSPLHFVCTQVRGCRQRIVELLLRTAVVDATTDSGDEFNWSCHAGALTLALQRTCTVTVAADDDEQVELGGSDTSTMRVQSVAQVLRWPRNRKLLQRLDERIQVAVADVVARVSCA
jgi:hypothetical protein